jgi:hypothetical protein
MHSHAWSLPGPCDNPGRWLFAGALLALWRLRLNSAWLIAAGAAVGLARALLT